MQNSGGGGGGAQMRSHILTLRQKLIFIRLREDVLWGHLFHTGYTSPMSSRYYTGYVSRNGWISNLHWWHIACSMAWRQCHSRA